MPIEDTLKGEKGINTSPFRNIGKGKSKNTSRNKKNPFKNIG
jgi:hypothetical protein